MEVRQWRHFDFMLFLSSLLLAGIGIALVYSASHSSILPDTPVRDLPATRQFGFVLVGLLFMALVMTFDYRTFGQIAPRLYVLALAILVAVLFLGTSIYGARRWIDIGPITVEPSEVAKVLMIIVLAKFFSDRKEQMRRFRTILISLVLLAGPIVLIYLEPHFSTVLVFVAIWLAMVVMAGARLTHLGLLALPAAVGAPLAYFVVLHDYMRERLSSFINPAADPLGVGYNALQAEISIGSGGFFGKGFAQGTQSQLHFLRVQSSDFIFSVLGEELGFVGAAVVLTLFLVLLLRGLRVAAVARDDFGRLVAVGVVTMVLFQFFVNVGVNVRLLPATGMPLPLVSQGGSSVVMLFVALGILQNIAMRQRGLEF
ncbi:MAG: rod shape-determining protein RodA [Chloroflexi bacterium]|nr:rod shape-determining protein RodA [Chloroflexota bacterium]